MSAAERRAIAVRALTIYERLAALPPSGEVVMAAESRGRQVLSSWQQAFSPGDAAAFARRLEWDGIEPHAVMAAASADDFTGVDTEWTVWIGRFGAGARAVLPNVPCDVVIDDVASPFAELWTACALDARRLCAAPDAARLTPRAVDDLVAQLTCELAIYGERALYDLFDNLRRTRGIDPDRATGSALYREFIVQILREEFATLFRDFPVAGRQLAHVAERWVINTRELLERLSADRQRLARAFNGNRDLGEVERIETGLSDPHDGRRRVAMLHFSSGVRIVYKPRDLTVDAAFAQLLTWFARHDLEITPPAPCVVCGEGYGWAEWIDQGVFTGRAAVARYFEQAGALLFMAHLLGARDLHMENLIAANAGPTIIDGELLLQPDSRGSVAFTAGTSDEDLTRRGESLLRTGLLSLVQIGPEDEPYELGGLRGTGHTAGAVKRRWRGCGTDALTFRDEPAAPLPVKNAVWFEKRIEHPEHYVAEIRGGFERAYRLAAEHRRELAEPSGPLAGFQAAELRVLVRPTDQYGLLSAVSNVSRYQRDAIAHSLLVDVLHRSLKDSPARPPGWPLVVEERRAVAALDVPRFVVRADELTVCSSGRPVLPGYYGRSALDMVRERIAQLSDADRGAHSRMLRHALTQNTATRFSQPCPVDRSGTTAAVAPAITTFIACAAWIADELICQRPETASTDQSDDDRDRLDAHVFYNGSIGAGVFLAALARVTGEPRWASAGRQAVQRCLALVDRPDLDAGATAMGIGGLAGLGSIVQGLTCAAALLGDAAILETAQRAAGRIDRHRIAADRSYDIVDGAAGALLALLTLHDATGDEMTLTTALACGDHLIAAQSAREAGAAWPSPAGRVLTGFAHGAAGISTALLRLAAVSGQSIYRDAARRGLEFVGSLFSPADSNWPIGEPGPSGRMNAWCHGAPGIALAAAAAVDVAPDLALVAQARAALPRLARWDVGQADHLCCGHLGRADVLLTAGGRLGVSNAAGAARDIASRVIARAQRQQHFRLSAPGDEYRVLDPGFFRGLSGIGYQLLRLAAPGRLPSLLAFEPVPRTDHA